MSNPTRRVRAGQPPTPLPANVEKFLRQEAQLHRVDASQLAGNDIRFSDPPEFESTPETRRERGRVWRTIALFYAVALAAIACVIVIATTNP